MTTIVKTHPVNGSPPDLDTIVSDLAALRDEVATLTNHLKTSAINGARGAAKDAAHFIGDEAERLYGKMAAEGSRYAKVISSNVEKRPIESLLLAFGIGFLSGRWLLR